VNIFYLDREPLSAARAHCDKHCVKMILETAQLLSTAHRELDGDDYADAHGLYKATHKNHPSAVWVRESAANYRWAHQLLVELCDQYGYRYGKTHKTEQLVEPLSIPPANISTDAPFTEPPQCMPDEYKRGDAVDAYRAYYHGGKAGFAEWRHSNPPVWWQC
jgi:hypothetical protein